MNRFSLWMFSFVCALTSVILSSNGVKSYKVVCYLGSWSNYRNGNGKFTIQDIDPTLCTHLIYGFAKLVDNKITPFDTYLDLKENYGLGAYDKFNGLKAKNPKLKTLIAIGGWNEGSVKYSKMASTPDSRKTFIESCLQFLEKHSFDGLDLDWEYPANRGGSTNDKQNFVLLLKELREAFEPFGYLLTAAVSAGKATVDTAYDVPKISQYLDFINLMTYDLHGAWDSVTGHNSPLYPRPEESASNKMLNVDYAVKYWLKIGAPAEKLILGMPLYGRTFTLQNPQDHGLGAIVTGAGKAGRWTGEAGFIGYNEICYKLKTEQGWTLVVNNDHKVPYAFKNKEWIGYDDVDSITLKVQYLKQMGLGGGMVWSVETDDFRGQCGDQRYPLLSAINKELNGGFNTVGYRELTPLKFTAEPREKTESQSKFTAEPREKTEGQSKFTNEPREKTESQSKFTNEPREKTVSQSKSTNEPREKTESQSKFTDEPRENTTPPQSVCTKTGYVRDPKNCKKFYYCSPRGSKGYWIYEFTCAPGTVFKEDIQTCAFPYDVPECNSSR